MPQVLILAAIGTGLYAGLKWAAKALEAQATAAAHRAEQARRHAAASITPIDRGTLEWDPSTGVYRPKV